MDRNKIIQDLVDHGVGEAWQFSPYATKDLKKWTDLLAIPKDNDGWMKVDGGVCNEGWLVSNMKMAIHAFEQSISTIKP